MEMNEIKALLPNCPRCGRHCPIDQTSCPRGQELVDKLGNGEMSIGEATASKGNHEHEELNHEHGHGHHHEHGRHGEHGHERHEHPHPEEEK